MNWLGNASSSVISSLKEDLNIFRARNPIELNIRWENMFED